MSRSLPLLSVTGAPEDAEKKERLLRAVIREMGSTVIALSGGVDSAYLSYIAAQELGSKALAVTGDSPSYPASLKQETIEFTSLYGIRHEIIITEEIEREEYLRNAPNRCYYCKTELFTKLIKLAASRGFQVVCDGNNLDDTLDYRPGRVAAQELSVRSPLIEAGMTKADIREMARRAGLPVWDKPAQACLSSRVPHGDRISREKLSSIERGEEILKSLGFKVYRLRHHGEIARLEIGLEEMGRVLDPETAQALIDGIKALGFRYVALDLEGYRRGSLNSAEVDKVAMIRQ